METTGSKIRKLREIRGFSQDYMALKLDISQEQYSYLETKQKNIPEDLVKKIAVLLDVTVEYIEKFDPTNIFQNTFYNNSNGYFNIEKLIVQSYENERKAHLDLIERLKEEIQELKRKK